MYVLLFIQDLQKQREEVERLRALLSQHNIPFDSKPSKSVRLFSLSLTQNVGTVIYVISSALCHR